MTLNFNLEYEFYFLNFFDNNYFIYFFMKTNKIHLG